MLVSFSVSNFRSFAEEQTFSMVASKRLGGLHENHVRPIPNSSEYVLKTALIYGANGAGKSNIFRALRYLRGLVIYPQKKNAGMRRERFNFAHDELGPTTLDVQFIEGNRLYRFGVVVDDNQILEEWFVEIVKNKEKVIYERKTAESGDVKVAATASAKRNDKVAALVKIGGPKNQTFIATINATLDQSDLDTHFNALLDWFGGTLSMIAPEAVYGPLGHELAEDSTFLKFAGDFLKASSTGVDHLLVQKNEITEAELRALIPANVWKRYMENQNSEDEGESLNVFRMEGGNNLIIEKVDGGRYYNISVQAAHKPGDGSVYPLELKEESDGTRRLLDLVPALHSLKNKGGVFFVDEIDRSMHPMLVRRLLEYFLSACTENSSQLILTTHESSLLDLDLVRRDEIWFAEKDNHLRTHLYSLVDFKVRTDLEIRKNYLAGRFGAIPFLGNLSKLTHTAESC
jgi:hypothetical protein